MEWPGGIRAARSEVVDEGDIDGLPARLERELQLVSVKDIAVEVARAVKEKEIMDRMARGVLGFCGTGKKGEQKDHEQVFRTHFNRTPFRNKFVKTGR
jgi:hypothetical protein